MNALFLLLAAAPVDVFAVTGNVQISGWSADGQKFSVRGFVLYEGSEGEEVESCPGYVDHQGKKFDGSLILAAYDGGELVQSWVVQDFPKCTPPAKAKETLAAAKAKFAELGIDLTAKGTTVKCKGKCELAPGVKLELENTTSSQSDGDERATFIGRLRATLIKGRERSELWKKDVKESYELMMGANMSAGFDPVEVAPGGKSFFLRAYIASTSMRGGSTDYISIGLFKLKP